MQDIAVCSKSNVSASLIYSFQQNILLWNLNKIQDGVTTRNISQTWRWH